MEPGYITRARAEHLHDLLIAGVGEIRGRFAERMNKGSEEVGDAKAVLEMADAATRLAIAELEALQLDIINQANAPEH